MSRVIKFRAWDIKDKYMFSVYSICFLVGGIKISAPGHLVGGDDEVWASVNDEFKDRLEQKAILMQFTGLLDKNGIEIYEGDLLEWKDDKDAHYEVFYNDNEAIFSCYRSHYKNSRCGGMLPQLTFKSLAVVGNIYENPELLKESA